MGSSVSARLSFGFDFDSDGRVGGAFASGGARFRQFLHHGGDARKRPVAAAQAFELGLDLRLMLRQLASEGGDLRGDDEGKRARARKRNQHGGQSRGNPSETPPLAPGDHRRQDEREQDCQGERDEDRLGDRDHEDGQRHRPELVEVGLNRRERRAGPIHLRAMRRSYSIVAPHLQSRRLSNGETRELSPTRPPEYRASPGRRPTEERGEIVIRVRDSGWVHARGL